MRMDLTRERLDMMLFPGAESRRSFLISDILGEQANTTCSTTLTTTATVTSIDNNSTPFVLYDGDSPLSEARYRPSHPHPYPPPTQKEDPVVVLRRMKQSSDDVERTRNKTPEYDEAMDRVDSETMESSFNPRGVKLPRKTRTIFTEQQLSSLELSFEQRKYLGIRDRLNLASKLQLTDAQVKTWYQNRRTKWKRETAGSYKMAPNQDNMAFLCRLLQGHQNSAPLTRPKIIFSHEICAPEAHFNFPSSSPCLYQSGDEILHPIRPMLPPLLLLRDLNIPNP